MKKEGIDFRMEFGFLDIPLLGSLSDLKFIVFELKVIGHADETLTNIKYKSEISPFKFFALLWFKNHY